MQSASYKTLTSYQNLLKIEHKCTRALTTQSRTRKPGYISIHIEFNTAKYCLDSALSDIISVFFFFLVVIIIEEEEEEEENQQK